MLFLSNVMMKSSMRVQVNTDYTDPVPAARTGRLITRSRSKTVLPLQVSPTSC